ncbi:DUF1653 domain-containing protein [Clostridium perfringens]|nr:DUF1653 domain-containing protein [Clostridium perfringens]MDK0983032.1 DUF1653 domain-containing protein [Clostridium perfringens]
MYIKKSELTLHKEKIIKSIGKYVRHFKGNHYQILGIGEHTETGEVGVFYKALYGEFKCYFRPLDMFCSYTDKIKHPEATQEFRFEVIENENPIC